MKRLSKVIALFWITVLVSAMLCMSFASMAETPANLLPEDLLSSREKAITWLHDEDQDGTTATYETEDGEYVMTVPLLTDGWAKGNYYMYSIQQIPYDSYTVSFDFQLVDSSVNFLMGVGENGGFPWTQLTLEPNFEAGQMMFYHNKHTGQEWVSFTQETMSYYDYVQNFQEAWFNLTVEVTADAITPYLDGYEIVGALEDTAGFTGGLSYFGFRASGAEDSYGFKVKNLAIYEGVGLNLTHGQEPTEEPTEAPTTETAAPTEGTATETATPTENSTATVSPTATAASTATVKPSDSNADKSGTDDGGNKWLIPVIVICVVVVAGVAVLIVVLQKKKKK